MTSITTQSQSLSTRGLTTQDLLARSLAKISSASPFGDDTTSSASQTSGPLAAAAAGLQLASGDAQTTLSGLQISDARLSGISTLLDQMQDVSQQAKASGSGASAASLRDRFSALQDELRAAMESGSSTAGADSMFGNGSDATTLTANFQQGALGSLTAQDGLGNYSVSPTDSSVDGDLASAQTQLADARKEVASSHAKVGLAIARLQVERQNLFSVVSPLGDAQSAQQANLAAIGNILSQGASALSAQSGQVPSAVLKMVEL